MILTVGSRTKATLSNLISKLPTPLCPPTNSNSPNTTSLLNTIRLLNRTHTNNLFRKTMLIMHLQALRIKAHSNNSLVESLTKALTMVVKVVELKEVDLACLSITSNSSYMEVKVIMHTISLI